MKFRIMSDIHCEFGDEFYIPKQEDDCDSTLLLAGDVGCLYSPRTFMPFIIRACEQFKYVFWVEGNHEWYHGNITKHSVQYVIDNIGTGKLGYGVDKFGQSVEKDIKNLHTERLEFPDEKIVVLGKTLWSDFDNADPLVMHDCKLGMNDYNYIKIGEKYSRFKPEDVLYIFASHKRYLFEEAKRYKGMGWKVVVVSHHHPSYQCIIPEYENHHLNGAFCSNLEEEIKESDIDYWVCGHIHTAIRYFIGKTEVICNPLGYPFEEKTFNSKLNIEIKKN